MDECMDVLWSEDSLQDRFEIYNSLVDWSSFVVADRTDEEIKKHVSYLSRLPEMGKKAEKRKGRLLYLSKIPYIISYEFFRDKNEIKILRILSSKTSKRCM